MKKNSKQRLFEVMGKVDKSFKPNLNEIGSTLASKTLGGLYGQDNRKYDILRNAFNSLFSKYLGKELQFFMKTGGDDNPARYKLIEIVPKRDTNEWKGLNSPDLNVEFHFYSEEENVGDGDAPFSPNKKHVILTYSVAERGYMGYTYQYEYNPFFANFLINAAKLINETYYTKNPIYTDWYTEPKTGRSTKDLDVEATENAKKSPVNKDSFKLFTYDSRNLMNLN